MAKKGQGPAIPPGLDDKVREEVKGLLEKAETEMRLAKLDFANFSNVGDPTEKTYKLAQANYHQQSATNYYFKAQIILMVER